MLMFTNYFYNVVYFVPGTKSLSSTMEIHANKVVLNCVKVLRKLLNFYMRNKAIRL